MKLDALSTPRITTNNTYAPRASADKGVALSEGDVVAVRVISSEDGNASLRTADGKVINARLEDGVSLPVGAEVKLVVTQSGSEVLTMALAEPGGAAVQMPSANPLVDAAIDRLVAMGATPDAETLTAMLDILSANPDMPLDEAAFLAAHKLPAEPSVLDAVRAALSGEVDTSSMLETLSRLAGDAGTAQGSGLAETAADANAAQALPGEGEADAAVAKQQPPAGHASGAESAERPPVFGRWLEQALSMGGKNLLDNLSGLTGGDLSQSPLFEGLSARSLAGAAENLSRIAQSMPELGSEAELFESIAKLADELLLNPKNTTEDAAAKLKSAREDLYVKLAYFRDAVSMTSAQSKDVILDQTQKLMDHVRLLNGLDQFVCMQLPIQIGDERKNAELYMYKKNRGGTKRIDPEDAKILLSLDLEHMGHLDAFIEIKGREVSLRFEVDDEGVIPVIQQSTTQLHNILDEIGFKFANSSVLPRKKEVTIESALSALLDFEQSKSSGFDFKI